jgi:hypothetical protein
MAASAKVAATAHGVRCSTTMSSTTLSTAAMSSTAARPSRIRSARENGHHHYGEKEFKLFHGTLRRHR